MENKKRFVIKSGGDFVCEGTYRVQRITYNVLNDYRTIILNPIVRLKLFSTEEDAKKYYSKLHDNVERPFVDKISEDEYNEYLRTREEKPVKKRKNTIIDNTIIKQQDKYRWHDLRKDTDDLPKDEHKEYLIACLDANKELCYDVQMLEHIKYTNGVIAWKEIERFEV